MAGHIEKQVRDSKMIYLYNFFSSKSLHTILLVLGHAPILFNHVSHPPRHAADQGPQILTISQLQLRKLQLQLQLQLLQLIQTI